MKNSFVYDRFIQKKKTHKSINTTNAYIVEIDMFFRFINTIYPYIYEGKIKQNVTQYNLHEVGEVFTYDLLDSYRDYLLTEYATSSAQKKLSIACNLVSFLGLMGIVKDTSFVSEIDNIRVFKKEVKFLNASNRQQLIRSLENLKDKEGFRDYVIIMTILTLGLRGFEIRELSMNNIDWENKTITFYAKGDKKENKRKEEQRNTTVIVNDFIMELFKEYIDNYRYSSPEDYEFSDVLFTTKYGKMMSQKSLGNLVEKRLRLAGFSEDIIKDITPHKLRATFITSLVEKNIHPLVIKDLARHESLATTTRYTGLDLNLGKEIMNNLMNDYYKTINNTGGINHE